MQFLSKELVTLDYRTSLQRDMAQAKVCRFLVAYVSLAGVDSINRPLLVRALRDPRSFGVATLSCACKYEPLLKLQDELDDVRLKYFMDPVVDEANEPSGNSLFHSKLVYRYLERQNKSIVYLGSHNWTRRALGPQGPRNAEASLRLEFDFEEHHLTGEGSSIASEVNQHLLRETLLIDPPQAKVLPYSDADNAKLGRRVSSHPLHETFLGSQLKISSERDAYYRESKRGRLLANLDYGDDDSDTSEMLPRVQRLFAAPVKNLLEDWRERANELRRTGKN